MLGETHGVRDEVWTDYFRHLLAYMQGAGSAPRFEKRPDSQLLQQEFTDSGTVSAGNVEMNLDRAGV